MLTSLARVLAYLPLLLGTAVAAQSSARCPDAMGAAVAERSPVLHSDIVVADDRRAGALEPTARKSAFEMPALRTLTNLVVFVRFSGETEFERPFADFDADFNSTETASLSSYFTEASAGKVRITSTFYPSPYGGSVVSYQDPKPRSYYLAFDASTNPGGWRSEERYTRERELVSGALAAIESLVPDSLSLDTNGDGVLDGFTVLVRGGAMNSGLLSAHLSVRLLDEPEYRFKGLRASSFVFLVESDSPVAVVCHEVAHLLGAPDLYRQYSSEPNFTPVGEWDLMASRSLAPINAFTQFNDLGWIDQIPEITASGRYTLAPVENGAAYRVASPFSPTEFFVLEYRRNRPGSVLTSPTEGLIAVRIDLLAGNWGNFFGPLDQISIVRPISPPFDGIIARASLSADSGRVDLSDRGPTTALLSDWSVAGLEIHNVGPAGETISFDVTIRPNCQPPGEIRLLSPRDDARLSASGGVELRWETANRADTYDVYFGPEPKAALVATQIGTSLTVAVEDSRRYMWWVVARNACSSRRSPTLWARAFSVGAPTSDEIILDDGFETGFPTAGWTSLYLSDRPWSVSGERAASGNNSLWTSAGELTPFRAGARFGPFSVEGMTAGTVEFDLRGDPTDLLRVALVTPYTARGIEIAASDAATWSHHSVDLKDLLWSDAGHPKMVWLDFDAFHPGWSASDGLFIDDVVLKRTRALTDCTITVHPSSFPVHAGWVSPLRIEVIASDPSCSWRAFTENPWITVQSGASRSGSGIVRIMTSANFGSEPRSGVVWIGGQELEVTQTACEPVSIAIEPADVHTSAGRHGVFAVTAIGTDPFTYQWYEGRSGDTTRPIAGARHAQFVSPAVEQGADYWVRVTNGCSSTDSRTVHVDVSRRVRRRVGTS